MCGIIGSINFLKNKNLENYEWVKSKIEYLKHRVQTIKRFGALRQII